MLFEGLRYFPMFSEALGEKKCCFGGVNVINKKSRFELSGIFMT